VSIGGHGGDGTLGNMGNLAPSASFAEIIRTNPSMRQMFIDTVAQEEPAFGRQLSQNPALLDSLLRRAGVQADPNLHTGVLTPEERGAVQRVGAILFFLSH